MQSECLARRYPAAAPSFPHPSRPSPLASPQPGRWLFATLLSLTFATNTHAACTACDSYQAGIVWGETSIKALTEASGIASSSRNPGVLWTHNDGSRKRAYAVSTNGATLATFNFDLDLDDMEDIAVGPGPTAGVSYLYFGDIGGNSHDGDIREDVQIIRVPEPAVSLAWAGSPETEDFADVQSFTLTYPDGSYDAETLLVDPITGDVLVLTKENNSARAYRANLNAAANGSAVALTFVQTVDFAKASGGDISADGKQIIVRRENAAMIWARCDNEPVGTALGRTGVSVPVIGPPDEGNGEAIAFLRDGTGYVTISEGKEQPIHFFRSTCLQPLEPPVAHIATNGETIRIQFNAMAGRSYSLEARENLSIHTWTPTGQSLQATTNGPQFFDAAKSSTHKFYRVVAQ